MTHKKKSNTKTKHLKSYSTGPWKVQEYSTKAGIQGLVSSEQARITDWRRVKRWEMVELKDPQL